MPIQSYSNPIWELERRISVTNNQIFDVRQRSSIALSALDYRAGLAEKKVQRIEDFLSADVTRFRNITVSSLAAITGTIGGWSITAADIRNSAGTVKLRGAGNLAFGATPPTSATVGTGVFIDNTGVYGLNANTQNFTLSATNGNITAIAGTVGGWTLASTTLTGGNATLANTGILTLGTGTDVAIIDAADATYRLAIGHSTYASAPFRVTKAGALTATSATITGSITGTSGSIGGWTIDSDSIDAPGGTVTMRSAGNLAFGATPPTTASTGTGIFISSAGLYGLASNVQQFYISATDGKGYFGAGSVVLDSTGITSTSDDGLTITQTRTSTTQGVRVNQIITSPTGGSPLGIFVNQSVSYADVATVTGAAITYATTSGTGYLGNVGLSILGTLSAGVVTSYIAGIEIQTTGAGSPVDSYGIKIDTGLIAGTGSTIGIKLNTSGYSIKALDTGYLVHQGNVRIGGTTDPTVALDVTGTVNISTNLAVTGTITTGTWNGSVIGLAYGGTNKNMTAVNGGIVWTDTDSMEVSAAGSSGQILRSAGAAAPTWSTATYPATAGTSGNALVSDGTNWASTALTNSHLPNRTRILDFNKISGNNTSGSANRYHEFPDGSTTSATFGAKLPADYVSGTCTVYYLYGSSTTGGNVKIAHSVYREANGIAEGSIDTAASADKAVSGTAAVMTLESNAVTTNPTAGDYIKILMSRDGAGDSNNGVMRILGPWLEYTADM